VKLKHAILAELGRDQLKRIVDDLEIDGVDRRSVDDMRQALSRARRATPALLLEPLGEAAVKMVCDVVGVSAVGRRTQLIERLLAEPPGSGDEADDKTPTSTARDAALDSSQSERRSPPRSVGATAVESPAASASKGKRAIEQYEHDDKERANNPPVGLVTSHTDPDAGKKRYAYDPHLAPTLVWAGKAEQAEFEVPTVSLHVHERIDPRTIIEAVRRRNGPAKPSAAAVQRSLFEEPEENPPLREAVDFYKHAHGWSNRLIAGDSLLVMNSLLEKEGLAGKVQMVYIDPPYGIKYGSNFQPFVNRRDVKDGKDEDLTQEPEMVRAFRDT